MCHMNTYEYTRDVPYEYTSTVTSKLFNFAPTISNLNASEYLSNP